MTSQPANAPPWPVFLHDAGHTGRSANSGPQGHTARWALRLGDYVRSSPVIGGDGTIYIGSWDYHLHAIDPDGSDRWQGSTLDHVVSTPALARDGTVYIGSYDRGCTPSGQQAS